MTGAEREPYAPPLIGLPTVCKERREAGAGPGQEEPGPAALEISNRYS